MALAAVTGVFAGTVLPVLVIAALGYALGAVRDVDVEPLNTVTLYVLLPALIAHSLLTTPLGAGTALRLFLAIGVFTAAMLLVAYGVGRAVGETGPRLSALVLAAAFPNVGNFGIPVAEFAFGVTGRTTAALFVAGQQVVLYTLGVYVASRGTRSARAAARQVVRLPLLYVVAVALLLAHFGFVPAADGTAMETLALLGNASIPVFLVVLGLELQAADPATAARRTAPAVGLKLLVAPAIGIGLATVAGFEVPAVAHTFAVETAAPAAITPLVLLVEFSEPDGGEVTGPAYLSTTILLTTLGSVPVVTVLITAIREGVLL